MVDAAHLWSLLNEVKTERESQVAKYPDCERLPDGTGGDLREQAMGLAKDLCELAYREGQLTHAHVFHEEACEALAETDPVKLRKELVQVMAVAAKWIHDIDTRKTVAGG